MHRRRVVVCREAISVTLCRPNPFLQQHQLTARYVHQLTAGYVQDMRGCCHEIVAIWKGLQDVKEEIMASSHSAMNHWESVQWRHIRCA